MYVLHTYENNFHPFEIWQNLMHNKVDLITQNKYSQVKLQIEKTGTLETKLSKNI